MRTWLSMWTYRIQESAAPGRPEWLHGLICPYCRGMSRYVRQMERGTR